MGDLTLRGTTLYGMTEEGGANGDGTIFSIPVTGGTPTILFSFDGTHGSDPHGSLTLSGTTLYGMTWGGGAENDGTIFSIPVTGGTPSILLSFDGAHGAEPYGSLTLSGSTLYGMTAFGGNLNLMRGNGDGTVFALHVLPGDANNDGVVDINDLTIVLTNFGQSTGSWSTGDFTGDGTVDINDLTIVLANFGATNAAGIKGVPEPSCMMLLGICAISLLAFLGCLKVLPDQQPLTLSDS